jgi:hypothetical protein
MCTLSFKKFGLGIQIIIIMLINLKLLILFVHNPDVLCYVILVISYLHLFFVYFLHYFAFPPVISCNLSMALYCVCP